MMKSMDENRQTARAKGSALMPVVICCGAFAAGLLGTVGYTQWQAQQQQLALMTQMVQQLSEDRQTAAPVAAATPTRNAPLDLLTVQAAPQPQVEIVPAAVTVSTPAAAAVVAGESTAERIRALVAMSSDPLVSAALAQDAARRETMSVAIQGVNELVRAAVKGDYTLSTQQTASGSSSLGIRFEGREDDQKQLETLLASAAEAGMIAFHDSVRSSDGTFDGEIILFDLIERALVNGSEVERKTGEALRQQALALLGEDEEAVVSSTPADASGARVYVVEPGDSLAFISLQFYGNTNTYIKIFEANRDQLRSPEEIQIGQRLVIPAV